MGSMVASLVRADDMPPDTASAFKHMLDSLGITEQDLLSKVGSTLMFGGSSPISFSGEGRVKLQYHNLATDQGWMSTDRSYISSGWEGNESMVRLGMVVRPGRNTVLWSKIGFQHTLPGLRWNDTRSEAGFTAQSPHDKSNVTANIHEDMNAGIAIRTVPASFWLKMGTINWVEASPLTIWKAQPRTFAWEFLPFEVEQPISRYFEYNIAKGEKAGRAAWHKKAFNGISLESISLPLNLSWNVVWAAFERYDNFEREYVDFSNDIAYAGDSYPVKGTGIGDSYRHIFHTRLAFNKLFGDLTPAINFNRIDYKDDVFTAQDANGYLFLKAFGVYSGKSVPLPPLNGTGFYKEPKILSLDLRGTVFNGVGEIHSDISISQTDTTFLTWSALDTTNLPDGSLSIVADSSNRFEKRTASSAFAPALFTQFKWNGAVPLQADVAAIAKGFYSPFSFVAPADAFYAFNSNMVGSGKFIARGEGSPYVQNMAGVLLSVMPKLAGYGHLRFAYGQHGQIEKGRDVLSLPYRLNGQDFSSLFHSFYTRWANGPVDQTASSASKYQKRLGDESFTTTAYGSPVGMDGGGLRTDYLSTFETFVPYADSTAARRNLFTTNKGNVSYSRTIVEGTDTLISLSSFVPENRKFTNNIEVDFAYDISSFFNYPNDLFIGGYAAFNNVTSAFAPLALVSSKGDEVQLWSSYFRCEPAIALTKKFYLLGLLGYENWRSEKSYMYISQRENVEKYLPADTVAFDGGNRVFNVPIDYRDAALGLGFDWGVLDRAGIHGRFKYMWHNDVTFSKNDWATPIVSLEIKTWF